MNLVVKFFYTVGLPWIDAQDQRVTEKSEKSEKHKYFEFLRSVPKTVSNVT